MASPNAYLHTRSYLSTLQKFSTSAPSTPKLEASTSGSGASASTTANAPATAISTEDATNVIISELDDDDKEFEDKEDSLRLNLAALIGRVSLSDSVQRVQRR